jgi:RimJ/RimL family protein N-acetyltransferase
MTNAILAPFANPAGGADALLCRASAANPFCTPEYAKAMQTMGRDVWIIAIETNNGADATLALIRRGRLSTELEIESTPRAASCEDFWEQIRNLCKRCKVTDLVVSSFGSQPFTLPPLNGEIARRNRHEFVLRLRNNGELTALSHNHRRNIRKAQNAGVFIRRTRDNLDWISEHLALMRKSSDRRIRRGESVVINEAGLFERTLLKAGAAELFQAVRECEVLSSIFVLLSRHAGYYQSAGTSPDGMSIGASHFLVFSVAGMLASEGREIFNLGGAEEGSSLARFKSGFGAGAVELPAATCYVGPVWKKKLRSMLQLVRSDRPRLFRVLTGSFVQWIVFRQDTTAAVSQVPEPPEAQFEKLDEEALRHIENPADDPEFRIRQIERLRRFGQSYAYAVRVGGVVAHISWLLPSSAILSDPPILLELREDEVEITACETLSVFRGKGIYPYAIQRMVEVARTCGIRRVYIKTRDNNESSQRGILKAGFDRAGSIRAITPPVAPSRTFILRNLKTPDRVEG